jgi:hypothetical protein
MRTTDKFMKGIGMSESAYPDGIPLALRRILGKFVFFNWPPTLKEMADRVSTSVLRFRLPAPEIDNCITYIDSTMRHLNDDELNIFWNSLGTQILVESGTGGRRILQAIKSGIVEATSKRNGSTLT